MTYITDPMTVTELDLVRWQQPTPLLDFRHPDLQRLIESRGWAKLAPHERIGALYDFVRNEIAFGYNASDNLPASQVLRDAIGHCNTKATLLMPRDFSTATMWPIPSGPPTSSSCPKAR